MSDSPGYRQTYDPAEIAQNEAQSMTVFCHGHPLAPLRPRLAAAGVVTARDLRRIPTGRKVTVTGLMVLVHMPPTKSGKRVIFITLEDETGVTNAVLWVRTFERFRKEVMGGRLLLIEGKVQRSPENVVHLMAERIIDRTGELSRLSETNDSAVAVPLSPADEFMQPQAPRTRHPRNVRILPGSRDFH